MTDLVLEALRDISPAVVADGSGHAVPLHRPALAAEAILGCVQ
jgi:hypothetical protein